MKKIQNYEISGQTNSQTVQNPVKRGLSKIWLLLLIPILITLGAGGAFAYNQLYLNSPKKVYEKALENFLSNKDSNLGLSVTMYDSDKAKQGSLEFEGFTKDSQLDGDYNLKAGLFNLTGSLQTNGTDKLYIKSNELLQIINQIASSTDSQLPADMKLKLQNLSGKWILIKPTDFTALGAKEQDITDLTQCLTVINSQTDAMKKIVKSSIESAKTSGAMSFDDSAKMLVEKVNGKDAYKIHLEIDQNKVNAVAKEIASSTIYKDLSAKLASDCSSASDLEQAALGQNLGDQEIINATTDNVPKSIDVWIDKKTKSVVQLATVIVERGANTELKVNMSENTDRTIRSINDNQVILFSQIIKDFSLDKIFSDVTGASDEATLFKVDSDSTTLQ